jgi:hypothetical protein
MGMRPPLGVGVKVGVGVTEAVAVAVEVDRGRERVLVGLEVGVEVDVGVGLIVRDIVGVGVGFCPTVLKTKNTMAIANNRSAYSQPALVTISFLSDRLFIAFNLPWHDTALRSYSLVKTDATSA